MHGRSSRLVRAWVRVYTAGLSRQVRAARRAEIESDVWEQSRGFGGSGDQLSRLMFGIPDDLAWRFHNRGRVATAAVSNRDTVRTSPRPRGPGSLYAVVALGLVVALASVALSARQSPPPTIAEFAPQAVDQITDSSEASAGVSDAASGEASALDEPTRSVDAVRQTVDVARVRQCVGDPPRQIEDPQAPPCVPYWEGDNGGATYKGVTRDEIRLVANGLFGPQRFSDALVAFFNKRFEFYGRRIRVLPAKSACDWASPAAQEALAVEADEQLRAFGAFGNCIFTDEVYARRGLVFINVHGSTSNAFRRQWHPYLWTHDIETEDQFQMFGSWMCARLSGGNARFAGTPDLQGRRRVFGLYFANLQGQVVDDGPLHEALRACGERFARVVRGEYSTATGSEQTYQEASNVMLQMREAGVTSFVLLTHNNLTGTYEQAGISQGYFPEWPKTSYVLMDMNFNLGPATPQHDHAFGLTFNPKWTTPQNTPAVWASTETDPDDQWWTTWFEFAVWTYRELLLYASGIQLAGPNLTPHTFAQGLHRARFPNPDHPIQAGKVGFTNGDYGMMEDAAEIWWSSAATNPWNGSTGAWCYVDGGVRARSWAKEPSRAFAQPCDSGA